MVLKIWTPIDLHLGLWRSHKFQKILERKLSSCFGQSCKLHIYWKDVEHGFEHDVDSSYGL